MIGSVGLLPLDYVRHFGPGQSIRARRRLDAVETAPGPDQPFGDDANFKPVSGQGRPLRPEPARRSTSGIGRDPGQGPAVPAPGEPSGHGTRAVERIPAVAWRRSRYSTDPGDCLEYAVLPDGGVALRHSRQPGILLEYTRSEWEAFVGGVHDGEFEPEALALPASGQSHQVGAR